MGLLREIQNLLNEYGSSSVLRDRLLLIKEQTDQLADECRDLKMKLTQFEEENVKLKEQLKAQTITQEFVEYRGAFFKRGLSGAYDPTVYCPSCHAPLGSMEGFFPYACDKCEIELDFNGKDLPQILKTLEELT